MLSDSTAAFDRGDKFADYKAIAAFEEYVLIHQTQILVEQFQRKSNSLWVPQIYRSGDTVEFASLGFSSASAMLYETIDQLISYCESLSDKSLSDLIENIDFSDVYSTFL